MVKMNSMDFYRHSPSTEGMMCVCVYPSEHRKGDGVLGSVESGRPPVIWARGGYCPSFTGIELIFFSVAGPVLWFGFGTGVMSTTQGCFGCC